MRADVYLTEYGHVASRQRAKTLIAEGAVFVDGAMIKKPSLDIDADVSHEITVKDTQKYVGRGGEKLEGAIEAFGIDASGRRALDIGASTGGFTDCLLAFGASHVTAVDAGVGQLAKKLENDPRVRSIEHFNARDIEPSDIGEPVDLIVMDVSFISATYIIPRFPALMTENGEAVCLIKPQFEVGRAMLGKGGIVKDPAAHRFAVERVITSARGVGLTPVGLIQSPIRGGDGNLEFLIHLKKNGGRDETVDEAYIRRVTGA